jgi:hypothetical protein
MRDDGLCMVRLLGVKLVASDGRLNTMHLGFDSPASHYGHTTRYSGDLNPTLLVEKSMKVLSGYGDVLAYKQKIEEKEREERRKQREQEYRMVTIAQIQQKFIDAGFQYQETIFNDGKWNNAYIRVAIPANNSPHYFENICGDYGWGRFDRLQAWQMAEEWLDARWPKIQAGESPYAFLLKK